MFGLDKTLHDGYTKNVKRCVYEGTSNWSAKLVVTGRGHRRWGHRHGDCGMTCVMFVCAYVCVGFVLRSLFSLCLFICLTGRDISSFRVLFEATNKYRESCINSCRIVILDFG